MTTRAESHVSVAQLATDTDRPVRTVRQHCEAGVIADAIKVGSQWVIPIESANAYRAYQPYDTLRKN